MVAWEVHVPKVANHQPAYWAFGVLTLRQSIQHALLYPFRDCFTPLILFRDNFCFRPERYREQRTHPGHGEDSLSPKQRLGCFNYP